MRQRRRAEAAADEGSKSTSGSGSGTQAGRLRADADADVVWNYCWDAEEVCATLGGSRRAAGRLAGSGVMVVYDMSALDRQRARRWTREGLRDRRGGRGGRGMLRMEDGTGPKNVAVRPCGSTRHKSRRQKQTFAEPNALLTE